MAKYADLPTVEVSIEVHASPAELWPIISDPNTPAAFSSELVGAVWMDPFTGPEPGAMFEGTNRHPAIGEWKVENHVAVCEPEREFGWDPGGPDAPWTRWRLRTEPNGDSTRLTFWAQMGLGPSGLTPAIEAMPDREEDIVANRLGEWEANMTATIEGIKALVEGS
ncbi:MAG: SRPBCC family protein [Acidimicrobiales bacterium]|nr:SRPBCC family protein [Acidimicrobiales bacterium]